MEFYHGTTLSNARGIVENGFRPRGGAVWFTTNWNYAKNRADIKRHDGGGGDRSSLKPNWRSKHSVHTSVMAESKYGVAL